MMCVRNNNRRGFSLVEFLVYIAVFTLVSAGALSLLLTLQQLVVRNQVHQDVTQNATALFETALYEIRQAEAVDLGHGSLALETTPGHLVLTRGATTTELYLSGDQAWMVVNGGTAKVLTTDDVTVNQLRFFHYDNGVTEEVRVFLELTAVANDVSVTKRFQTGAVLRGSYE